MVSSSYMTLQIKYVLHNNLFRFSLSYWQICKNSEAKAICYFEREYKFSNRKQLLLNESAFAPHEVLENWFIQRFPECNNLIGTLSHYSISLLPENVRKLKVLLHFHGGIEMEYGAKKGYVKTWRAKYLKFIRTISFAIFILLFSQTVRNSYGFREINPFVSDGPFLFHLKTSKSLTVFCFGR